jgi:hypothetical protein
MPEVGINKLLGTNLIASKKLDAYSLPDKKSRFLFSVPAGGNAGRVYSWIEKPDGIWLMFNRSGGGFYYILSIPKSFKATEQIKQLVRVEKAEQDKELKEEKGSIPFYIEKYGKWILIYGVGAYLIATYIKTRK